MKYRYLILIGALALLFQVCVIKFSNLNPKIRFFEPTPSGLLVVQLTLQSANSNTKARILLANNELEIMLFNGNNQNTYTLRFHTTDSLRANGEACANSECKKTENIEFEGVFVLFVALFSIKQLGHTETNRPFSSRHRRTV